MLKTPRWEAEIRMMHSVYPQFEPFAVPEKEAGFQGYFVGPRSGIRYEVAISAPISRYPEKEPAIYMDPHPENHHWISDNRLCYQREGHVWNGAKHTFAQALSFAVKYIHEFDRGRRNR